MAWIYLMVAGLLEIGWAIGLKYTEGFSKLWPSLGTVKICDLRFAICDWGMAIGDWQLLCRR